MTKWRPLREVVSAEAAVGARPGWLASLGLRVLSLIAQTHPLCRGCVLRPRTCGWTPLQCGRAELAEQVLADPAEHEDGNDAESR